MGNVYTLFDVQDWKTTHYDGRQRWADVTSHWATVVYGVERVLYVVEISLAEPIHYPLPWTLRLISALQQPNNTQTAYSSVRPKGSSGTREHKPNKCSAGATYECCTTAQIE